MKPSNLSYGLILVLVLLSLAACGPITPTPTVPVKPNVGTPTVAPGTPGATLPPLTATPIRTPSNTPVPTDTPVPTETPTITSTPTDTPQPTVVNTPAPGPTTIVEAGTGVGRDQYNEALAKWRSQSIEEYEMVIEYVSLAPFAGTWTLKVVSGTIEVLGYARDGAAPATPPAGVVGDALKFLTVEDRFALIETRLTDPEVSNLDKRVEYVVEYDQGLGYPSLIDIREASNPALKDLANKTSVKSLTIIRRGTPQPQQPTVTPTATAVAPATTQPTASPAEATAAPQPSAPPTATGTVALPTPTSTASP